MANQSSPNNSGAFIQTTNVWDVNQLYDVEVTSPAFKELLVRLYQNLNNMSLILNMKDTGFYVTDREFVCGQNWFPNPANSSLTPVSPVYRNAYRKVISFGALPNTTTKSVPHGITCTTMTSFTRIYGTATNPTSGSMSYIPIPYASATASADCLELFVDATNVNITTGADYSSYTICYIVLEYLKF